MLDLQKQKVTFQKHTSSRGGRSPEGSITSIIGVETECDLSVLESIGVDWKEIYMEVPKDGGDLADQGGESDTIYKLLNDNLSHTRECSYEGSFNRAIIHIGIDDDINSKSNLFLVNVDVKKFVIKFMDGGKIVITFNINCKPNQLDMGRSVYLQYETHNLTLEPHSKEKQAELLAEG